MFFMNRKVIWIAFLTAAVLALGSCAGTGGETRPAVSGIPESLLPDQGADLPSVDGMYTEGRPETDLVGTWQSVFSEDVIRIGADGSARINELPLVAASPEPGFIALYFQSWIRTGTSGEYTDEKGTAIASECASCA